MTTFNELKAASDALVAAKAAFALADIASDEAMDAYQKADSANSPAAALQPQYRKVWLAELKPSGKQYSVCHTRTTGTGYFDEIQATISRDGKRITYASNLGSGASDSYLVEVP